MPSERVEMLRGVGALPLLRAVCQRVGIQLRARAVDLSAAHPFTPEDILNLFPVVVGTVFPCTEGQEVCGGRGDGHTEGPQSQP